MPETVLVTGASRGIGRAVAELFAARGYNVLVNYCKSSDDANMIFRQLNEKGLSVDIYRADVSSKCQVFEMIDYCVDRFGSIDVLVNNAGVSYYNLLQDISEEEWRAIIDINLSGCFFCCQAAAKYMIPQKSGRIINISSIWGIAGASCESHYSAAKAGIIGLTKALAKELGPSNIKVNCVAPGVIKTDMLNNFSEEELELLRMDTPLMRLGDVMDVAECVYYLASPAADFITGQIISPNGGIVT